MGTTTSNELTVWQTVLRGADHYRRHPALMLPFLIQGALGVGLTWLSLSVFESLADGPFGVALIALGLLSFLLQLWGIGWVGATLNQPQTTSPGAAFRLALRRWPRALGLALIAALPAGLLLVVFIEGTVGVFRQIGMALSFGLAHWLYYLGYIGILDANGRAWQSLKDATLLLAARPPRC